MWTRLALASSLAVLLPQGALAFDCGKAETAVEKAICAAPALRVKDDEMSALYAQVKAASTPAEQKMLARAQRQWIADREAACDGAEITSCIGDKLDERIALFKVTPESGPGTGAAMMPVFVAQAGDARHYTVAFNLVRFTEAKTAGEKAFNRAIAAIVKEAPLADSGQDTGPDRTLESDSDITINYASPKLISAAESHWADDGGAHGNGGVDNINIDLANGKALAVEDVFSKAAAAKLQSECRNQIIADKKERNDGDYKVEDDSFLSDQVIAEHIATMSRWSFTATEATVNFDSYAIGAYAEGSFECVFPMKDLKAVAKPGAPLPE